MLLASDDTNSRLPAEKAPADWPSGVVPGALLGSDLLLT
jgi:hypothetical protein